MNKRNKKTAPTPRMRTIIKARIQNDGIMWMTGHEVNRLTKWSFRDLEILREGGHVTIMREGNKVLYDIDTVHIAWEKWKKFKTA